MRSLRTRVFVTVAVVLAAATLAAGLLSRRATLARSGGLGPRRLRQWTAEAASGAASGGRVGRASAPKCGRPLRASVRMLAVNREGVPWQLTPELRRRGVKVAQADGTAGDRNRSREARAKRSPRRASSWCAREAAARGAVRAPTRTS